MLYTSRSIKRWDGKNACLQYVYPCSDFMDIVVPNNRIEEFEAAVMRYGLNARGFDSFWFKHDARSLRYAGHSFFEGYGTLESLRKIQEEILSLCCDGSSISAVVEPDAIHGDFGHEVRITADEIVALRLSPQIKHLAEPE